MVYITFLCSHGMACNYWSLAGFSINGFKWIFIGCSVVGLAYTFGAIIYAIKKPNSWSNFFGFHEIFHVFVMFGSIFHFMMMYLHMLPVS